MSIKMEKRTEINNELQSLGLQKLATHNPNAIGDTPIDFFDSLPKQLIEQIEHQSAANESKPSISLSWKYLLAYAASVLLLVAVGIGFWHSQTPENEIANENLQLEEYFINLADSDRNMFYELIQTNGSDISNEESFDVGVQDDDVFEYLLDVAQLQGMDVEDFIKPEADNQQQNQ